MANNFQRNQNLQFSQKLPEQAAGSFPLWEQRGRGWQVFDCETNLEPVFSRFLHPQRIGRANDDARVPRLFGKLFSNKGNKALPINDVESPAEDLQKIVPQQNQAAEIASFRLRFPKELKISSEQTEQLIQTLTYSACFIGFEIIGTDQEIIFQIICPKTEESTVFNQLKIYFPALDIRQTTDWLKQNFQSNQINESAVVDFGLGKEWFIPLPFGKNFAGDTLLPLIASVEELRQNETVCLQVLLSRTRADWQKAVQEAIFDQNGKLIFSHFINYLAAIKEKLSCALFAASVRFAASSSSAEKSLQIIRRNRAFFRQFSAPSGNELIPLRNDGLLLVNHFQSVLNRTSYRNGILVTAKEISAIIHLPSNAVESPKLKRDENLTKPAPDFASRGNFVLGENHHGGITRKVSLNSDQRIKHTHLIGSSGSGKSTLLTQNIVSDLEINNGFACFDPHGDLIDAVTERIPKSRLKDVILFDPADEEYPIGFNILSAHSELEKTLLASDLVSIFRRFSTSWGDVMNSILANAVLAFLESSRGGNLIDLKRFLIEKSFREDFLRTVEDEEIRRYWLHEFPQIKGKPYSPLLTRLDTFLRSKLVRRIVAQRENKLDFRKIMDERKILLVRLSLGAIGEENAYLLGSLLVSKLYQATLSRQNVAADERPPFFLYLDEAHHFVAESMNQILSGVRKYKLGLVLAHQQLRQFEKGEADILSSVLSNCYTRVCFRLDDADAERLARGFSFFTAEHLKNLGVGEAIARFEQSRYDFNLRTFPLAPVDTTTAEKRKKTIIEQSRRNYAKTKAAIEAENNNERSFVADFSVQPKSVLENLDVGAEPVQENQQSVNSHTFAQTNHGRGGRHHQELQAVIRRMAESYDFSVEIEKNVLDGAGSVDVSLEKENLRIACEVSVTSTVDYEAKNVLKCLAAGYHYALVVVSNLKKLPVLERKLRSKIPTEQLDRVKVFGLTGLLAFLSDLSAPKEIAQKNSGKTNGQRMNFTQACEFFGVNSSTLYRWIGEGRVPFYRPGREYQFDRDELVLLGKHDLSGKRKTSVKIQPLKIEKIAPKSKKEQNSRYRKLLKLD